MSYGLTVQMKSHCHFACRKYKGETSYQMSVHVHWLKSLCTCCVSPPPTYCITFLYSLHTCRPKYPIKVYMWAEISERGRTGICTSINVSWRKNCWDFIWTLATPFSTKPIQVVTRIMTRNTSGHVAQWMRDNGINWWKAPAESPDLNWNNTFVMKSTKKTR